MTNPGPEDTRVEFGIDDLRSTLTRVQLLIADDHLVRCSAEDIGMSLDDLREEVAEALVAMCWEPPPAAPAG